MSTTAQIVRLYNLSLFDKIMQDKPAKKVFKVDAKDPNYNEPLYKLNKNLANAGHVVCVTRFKGK